MQARYQGRCQYCSDSIEIGDDITKGRGGRHASYSHVRCVPSASAATRANFAAVVIVADERGWIPVGTRKQYVRESLARRSSGTMAQTWRNCRSSTPSVQFKELRDILPANTYG